MDIDDTLLGPYGEISVVNVAAVRVSADGWEIVKTPPTVFRRFSHQQALPCPERGGDVDEIRRFLNVAPGRAFYGLRRQATDMTPEFEPGTPVLNRPSGRADGKTRERVYQDRESEPRVARAAEARRRMRESLREAKGPDLRVVA